MNGYNQLVLSINKCNVKELKSFIYENKTILKGLNNKSFDILIYVIEINAPLNIIKVILHEYKNVNFEIKGNRIPLFLALQKNNFALADLLIKNNADINYNDSYGNNILIYLYFNKYLN
ncbi:hypothetical protein BCR36DRAFT_290270, partial [Piromyces finnis]